jgi:hypothetical protein
MANGLASIIGGLAQGITDFGKSAADMFGGAATNNALTVGLDALLNKKSLGQASADARQRQNDYRKWLYDAKTDKDAAAKGLGTALNGAQAVMDFVPGIGQSAPVNALQGAIGGLADEFKFNGENYDLGRAAGRAAIGAGANVAAGGLGKALANSGSKVLSNGVLRGAAAGGLSGAISQGGNAAIEGGNADQILQSAAQGAKFGALMGAGTGGVQTLAGALKNARAKNSAPALDGKVEIMAELAPEQVYYHGSPEADITEFDIKRAGKNTGSGEKAIFFTDSPSVADEYSYERKPTDSMFVNEKGKKGKVYRANLKMDNTLDLDNLTDDQIRELWNYATPLGKLNGQEDFIQKMTDWRDKYHNAQLTKGYLDLAALQNSPYDSFSARMYPNTDNTAKEYGVFNKDQISLLPEEPQVMAELAPEQNAVAGAMLSPEQKEFFKDSVIRDENGNLMPLYHGSNSKFTVFDKSKGGQSNKTAKVGHWFTPNKEAAEKWAKQAWWGDKDPTVYETYLNIKKPMVYEAVDNSAQIKKLQAQLEQAWDNISSTYRGSKEYYDAYKEYNNIARQIDDLSFTDPYEQFRSDIYAMEGKTPSQANVGGVGMVMNDEDAAVQKYIDMLKGEGYDGIIIKGTGYDQNVMGGPNDQYVVFDSNQIKDVNNLTPTDNADIMAERAAPGQLGLFDQTATKAPETGYSQLGLFDQPTQPVTPKTIDVADVNPYAPVNGKITDAMRERAAEIENMAMTRKIPENELFNRVDPETLPTGRAQVAEYLDEAYKQGVDPGKMLKEKVAEVYQEKLGEAPDRDKLEKFVFGDVTPEERAKKIYDYFGTDLIPSENALGEMAKAKIKEKIVSDELSPITVGNRTVRGGYTGSLDTMLSERLGIAPGYTYKKTGEFDTRDAHGRFESWKRSKALNNIMVEPTLNNEDAISTMAHERLHSFQEEANTPDTEKRFSPEVRDAYEELTKDLRAAKAYKSGEEIKKLYYGNVPYWRKHIEQEARMLQQYLNENGYTDSPRAQKKHYYKDDNGDWKVKETEFDNERINPAFDKFINKLRDLSKRGIALPAILAALGGGAYMANQEEDENNNGQQI